MSSGPPDPGPPDPGPPDPGPPDLTDRLRRRVLWAMPTGLYVVGTRAGQGAAAMRNLMTANLVVQVSVEPKLVAVAVDATAVSHRLAATGGCFTVNLLDRADRALVRRFVKPVAPETLVTDAEGAAVSLAGEAVFEAVTGAPVLLRAAAWLDCAVRQRLDLGSHGLFVGEVVGVGEQAGDMPDLLRMEDTRMSYGG